MASSIANCTLDTCPESMYAYGYQPNLGINVFFCVLFAIITAGCIAVTAWKRKWIGYSVAIGIGALLEVVGYVGRVQGAQNPFNVDSFSLQFALLTVAPVFTTAGIYVSIRYLANKLGRGFFNINPKFYTWFFIPSDMLALAIQASGAGIATSESTSDNPPTPGSGLSVGTKITIGGLVLQFISTCIFIFLFTALVLPYVLGRRSQQPKQDIELQGPQTGSNTNVSSKTLLHGHSAATAEGGFRSPMIQFIGSLFLASILLLIRAAFRLAEFSQGLESDVARSQGLFIALDGFMVLIASASLTGLHPALLLED